jgi:Na+/H+ antiporter NhaC
MIEKIKNLIDLKSILTILIAVTLVAIIFAHINIEDESIKTLFISIASAVFTSYFQKDNKGNAANTEANK